MSDSPAAVTVAEPQTEGEGLEVLPPEGEEGNVNVDTTGGDVASDAAHDGVKKSKKKKKKKKNNNNKNKNNSELDEGETAAAAAASTTDTGGGDVNATATAGVGVATTKNATTSTAAASAGSTKYDAKTLAAIQAQLAKLSGAGGQAAQQAPTKTDPREIDHKFWKTQPVPQFDEPIEGAIEGAIEADDLGSVSREAIPLPPGFSWSTLDITDEEQLEELYSLLNKNYVEDDDNMFRFDYSKNFLRWALTPPGYKSVWHCGVRNAAKGNLLAFISGVPADMRMSAHTQMLVEINFLCVHKRLRSKRVAPALIKEITRRVNLEGTFQAVYTAGVVLPRPVGECQYWHRSLNPKKLVEIGFSYLPQKSSMARHIKKYRLPAKTSSNLVPLSAEHVDSAHALVTDYLTKFKLAPAFTTRDEFAHWLLPRAGVINAYVVIDGGSGNVTDFISFYELPSTIVRHKDHKTLKACYSYYNVATSMPFQTLMKDALILAKRLEYDVYNCLNLMDNTKDMMEELKFGPGDGKLRYYLYNYRMAPLEPKEVGLVLL